MGRPKTVRWISASGRSELRHVIADTDEEAVRLTQKSDDSLSPWVVDGFWHELPTAMPEPRTHQRQPRSWEQELGKKKKKIGASRKQHARVSVPTAVDAPIPTGPNIVYKAGVGDWVSAALSASSHLMGSIAQAFRGER